MLTELHLLDFKSFQDQTVALSPLTLLVGANAAGKSNLLDALLFLQGLARDLTLTDVLRGRSEGGRMVWPGIRGGSGEVVRKGAPQMTLQSRWQREGETITHRVTSVAGAHPLVVAEALTSSTIGPYLFDSAADALVLIIPEDPTLDQHILKPLVERIFGDLDRTARVEVLQDPLREHLEATP